MILYGIPCNADDFSEEEQRLTIEFEAIRRGGRWGNEGLGLPAHFKNACHILWPHIDWHRWTELTNSEIRRENAKVTVLMGAGSTGKTANAAWQYLLEYYCRPNETLVLVSSTDMRGLELRVWGEIKSLHEIAVAKFPWLTGHLVDSKHCICTDNLSEDDLDDRRVRDIRKGIIGIPCVQNGRFIGLKNYVGVKQRHIRLIADEAQFMGASFLSAFTNLNNNVDFQAIVLGNPAEELDPLGVASEPVAGWSSHVEPLKTMVWDTRFYHGRCVNLVGTDSPNFDLPEGTPARYKYLVSREKIADTVEFYGDNSFEYYSQCKGVMRVGQMAKRVLTRQLCQQFEADKDCTWDGPVTKICGLDASYGGDRCVTGHIEFGRCSDGKYRIRCHDPVIVPLKVKTEKPMEAEDQIAVYVKNYCENHGIKPEFFFHDSTGRGSLGTSLARIWSADCNPVEFGGSPSKRPVRDDLFINDESQGVKRLKRADEHYSKFVTELWFSVRYLVEAGQCRNLDDDVRDEFCMREWRQVKGNKYEIESKDEMKERTRRSPDLADWLAICVEGARRKGFKISKLGESAAAARSTSDWLTRNQKDYSDMMASRRLSAR